MKRNKLNYSLPQDVMTEILLRLPFESILALKRVSKQWKELINDPKFFNRYRDKFLVVFLSKDGLYCLLVRHGKKIPVTVNGFGHLPFTMRHITIGSTFLMDEQWSPVMPCNGMTYVVTRRGDFHLYNLFTGASYTVTAAPLQEHSYKCHTRWICHEDDNRWICCHGFGYDSYEDDYKILVVTVYFGFIRFVQEGNNPYWVYSLRNRVWKRLEGFPYAAYVWYIGPRLRPCSLNGVLHWGLCTSKPQKPVIVTYDLHTCRFGEIAVPKGYNHLWAKLCELRGQLCCWKLESEFHLWVMKEYGVSESWTVLFRIHVSTVNRRAFRDCIEPAALYECPDGRKMLLLVCRIYGSLYWYDIHNDEFKLIHQSTWQKRRVVGGRGNKKSLIVARN